MIAEDMSHLIQGMFQQKDSPHYSQDSQEQVRVKILYAVPTSEETDTEPFRMVTIKVPKYYPIYQFQRLLSESDKVLKAFYGDAVRVGALTQKEGHSKWIFTSQIPRFGIVYI